MNLSATDGLMALKARIFEIMPQDGAYSCKWRSRTTIRRSIVCT